MNKKTIALSVLFIAVTIFSVAAAYVDDRNVYFSVAGEEIDVTIRLNTYEETIKPYYNEKEDVYIKISSSF